MARYYAVSWALAPPGTGVRWARAAQYYSFPTRSSRDEWVGAASTPGRPGPCCREAIPADDADLLRALAEDECDLREHGSVRAADRVRFVVPATRAGKGSL